MPQTGSSKPTSKPDLSDGNVTPGHVMRYLESVEELPMLSTVAIRINAMLQDMETTAEALAAVIEKDQAIVTKLLKLTNSSFFGFNSKVSNTAHAVMILGFNTVLNAVLSMAVIDALGKGRHKRSGLNMNDFWNHAVRVAVVSRHLSKSLRGHRHENAFTAGIIHDIGKVVMAQFFTDRFLDLMTIVTNEDIAFRTAEKRLFPMGHDAMGAFLARRWHLPDDLSAAIAQHHHPEMMPQANPLALVVNAADAIVSVHIEGRGPADQWTVCRSARNMLGDIIETVDDWLPQVEEEIENACRLMLQG